MLSVLLPLALTAGPPAITPDDLEKLKQSLNLLRAPPNTPEYLKQLQDEDKSLKGRKACKLRERGLTKYTAFKHPWICERKRGSIYAQIAALELYYPNLRPSKPTAGTKPTPTSLVSQLVEDMKALTTRKAIVTARATLLSDFETKYATAMSLTTAAEAAPNDATKVKAAKEAIEATQAASVIAESLKPEPADKQAEKKPEEKSDAEKDLDKLKAGKLIRWGITAGVGPAFYAPLHTSGGRPAVPGVGAITYVMFHPFYWRNAPAQNIYCANQWSGTASETVASRAADDAAKERAEPLVENLLTAQKSGALDEYTVVNMICPNENCKPLAAEIIRLAEAANSASKNATQYKSTLNGIVQRYTLGWTSGIAAKCGSRRFGLWAGYPIKYSATLPYKDPMGDNKRDKLEVTPLFAGGLGFSPNAYVSLLAGVSFGHVNLPPGKDKDDELVVSLIMGIGGNLDILGLLTK